VSKAPVTVKFTVDQSGNKFPTTGAFDVDEPKEEINWDEVAQQLNDIGNSISVSSEMAQKQVDAYMEAWEQAGNYPKVMVTWYIESAIFAKTIEVIIYLNGQATTVKYTLSEEILKQAETESFEFIKANIAGKLAQELAFKHPLNQSQEHYVYSELLAMFSNGSPAEKYAHTYAGTDQFSTLASKLPAVDQMVKHPSLGDPLSYVGKLLKCKDNREMPLQAMVIHLNDHHKWTRERIADWIDDLHDSGIIDAEFHIETEVEDERSS
jgi:hypothetical protein